MGIYQITRFFRIVLIYQYMLNYIHCNTFLMFRLSISAPIVINKATSFDLLWRHATCYLKYQNRKLHQDNVLIFNVTRLTRGVLPFSSSLEIRLLSCFKILLTTSILPFLVARCKGFSSLSFFKVPMNGLVISISISTNSI